ncbi:hypothetical protein GOBAR_AA35062 [Gossypium barbadense]|uniref:Uncharacterized protein n=1 Tax=Gossypium barbadense TaxID=3634 RepID=A0A2P5W3I5_GOSBA|nr:hypothetical protein GOBAR_AA35062 [Gossypium barbadense]
MTALYCLTRNVVTEIVKLFTELVDVELVQNVTSLNQEYGIQDPYGEEGPNNDGRSDKKGEDPDLDEVLDDINDDDANDDENVYTPFVGNLTCGIVIHNEPRTYMLSVDLDGVHASEFLEYPNIIPSYRLAVDSKAKELFVECHTGKHGGLNRLRWNSFMENDCNGTVVWILGCIIQQTSGVVSRDMLPSYGPDDQLQLGKITF